MTTAKTLALTAGLAGAIALGVWAVPRVMDNQARSTDAAGRRSRRARGAGRREGACAVDEPRAVSTVAMLPASAPALHETLKPVLNRGTKMEIAAEGFSERGAVCDGRLRGA